FKQKTAYEITTGDWSSDVCSSDLRLQRPRVVRARDAVGAVPAAVEQRSEVHARDGAVFFHAGLDPHQRGVTPAVAVEHFLARERDLHGPTRDHGQLGR